MALLILGFCLLVVAVIAASLWTVRRDDRAYEKWKSQNIDERRRTWR